MMIQSLTSRITRRAGWRWLPAVLMVLVVLAQSAAPAAYAFQPPPSCTVVGWGDDAAGQATPPAGLSDVIAIAAGGEEHSLALKSDGTVVGWGDDGEGQATPPAGLSDVTAIAAGGLHSLALKSDGMVVGWGDNFGAGAETPPAGLSDVIAIAAGRFHSLALKSDGTVVGWGDNSVGQATPPAGLSDVTAISAGLQHSLALKSDGMVVGWGDSLGAGAETPPAGLGDVTAIAAGYTHNLALQCVPPNTAPVANDDSHSTNEDTPLTVAAPGVLGNDSDAENDVLTAVLFSGPSNGTLTFNPDGSFSYTPAANFSGTDSFTYTANDGQADSNLATVSLTVVSAADQINHLAADVQALVDGGALSGSHGQALTNKLDIAQKQLVKGNTAPAINNLQEVINQVNDFIANGHLTSAQGQPLIDAANAIINSVS